MSKLVTRLLNALKATDVSMQVFDSVKTISRKLNGTRANPKKNEEEKKALSAKGIEITEISS